MWSPTTTIAVNATQGVQSVTDPVGNRTSFTYTPVSGAPKPLITLITAATGARTAVTYQSPSYQTGLTAVATLKTTDAAGTAISPVQTFSLDPPGNNRHNFTGFPNHLPTAREPDALFASGDSAYTYTTALTTGATTTLSTYDALHRLIRKQIAVTPAPGQAAIAAQTHEMTYPTPVQSAGTPTGQLRPPDADVSLTESSATSPDGLTASSPRTTTTATSYDDHGRVVSATDEVGTTTTTEYDDRYGLVTSQTTTGADGTQSQMVNTLTADGSNIATSTTSVATDGGPAVRPPDPVLRVRRRRAARPPAAGLGAGRRTRRRRARRRARRDRHHLRTLPRRRRRDPVDHHHGRRRHLRRPGDDDHHRPGFGQAGRPHATPWGGRRRSSTTPSGGGPRSPHRAGWSPRPSYTPTQTTVTTPDGRVTRTTVDLLGRTVSITDNVRNGALVADPGCPHPVGPLLQPRRHVDDGHRPGRPHDDDGAGRVRAHGQPGGADRAHPSQVLRRRRRSHDGRRVGARGRGAAEHEHDHQLRRRRPGDSSPRPRMRPARAGRSPIPVSAKAFDGLGQPTAATGNDLTVTTDLSGPGGIAASSTAAPQSTRVPG